MDYDKNDKKYIDSNVQYTFLDCVDKEINFNALLHKYGPEGLYMIADKLKELADEDMRNGLAQCDASTRNKN